LAELSILDVGHGNCAVLFDAGGVSVFDAPSGDVLLTTLRQRRVEQISLVVVSHADADHLGGILSLLLNFKVGAIYINPDASKETKLWYRFRTAVQVQADEGHLSEVHVGLTTSNTGHLSRGEVRVEVLAPTPPLALGGVGGRDLHGRPLSSNSLSAVLRLSGEGVPSTLFPGDLDAVGLDNLLESGADARARVLVFPHHGARSGSEDDSAFAFRLCRAVEPEVVIFSIGRGVHQTPRPEVVAGVRVAAPDAYIACTQLSEHCAAEVPEHNGPHLCDRPARGKATRSCCAGTLVLGPGHPTPLSRPVPREHQDFITESAATALCRTAATLPKTENQ
jgi:beta-lactamase superfamily II metal-dependent hydrolase